MKFVVRGIGMVLSFVACGLLGMEPTPENFILIMLFLIYVELPFERFP